MTVSPDMVELLIGVISGIVSYLIGHRRGRKVHRSGDYIEYHKGEQ